MKQLNEVIDDIQTLINNKDSYIIFNDGKAVKSNVKENIDIQVNDRFSGDDYCDRETIKYENDIVSKSKFSPTIYIGENVDLKIFHVCDESEYIDYTVVVSPKVKVKITNLYLYVVNKANIRFEVLCNDNSDVEINTFCNFKEKVHLIDNYYVLENVNLKINNLISNDKKIKQYSNVYMLSKNSSCESINSIINNSGNEQTYNYNVYHIEGYSKSKMNNYVISKNDSKINFNSNGIIKKGAVKTEVSQKTKGIILDMKSEISANPLLQIDENDVLANHGASIGAIDENDLYYLMSRGLTRLMSEELIIGAFFAPYLNKINDTKVLKVLNNKIKL